MCVFTGLSSNQTQKWGRRVFVLLFLFSASVLAQLPTATILGVVRDSSGALIPGVKLTIVNTDTGQTREALADENGSYRAPALPVGNYDVHAAKDGFPERSTKRPDTHGFARSSPQFYTAGRLNGPDGIGNRRGSTCQYNQ